MRCPGCGKARMVVYDTKPSHVLGAPSIVRRRKCPDCGKRVTSHEITAPVFDRLRSDMKALRTALEMTRMRADELEDKLNKIHAEVPVAHERVGRPKGAQPRVKTNGGTCCYDKKPMGLDDFAKREAEAEARRTGRSVEEVLREWGPM